MTTRAQVNSAVLASLQSMTFASPVNGATTWNTVSNRLRLWGDVPADQQPYVALVNHREMHEYRNLGVLRRRLDLVAWCYCRSDVVPGGPLLDTMLEAFEQTFLFADDESHNANTLNGLVYWIRIEGRIYRVPGDIDNQAMMMVPLSTEMP